MGGVNLTGFQAVWGLVFFGAGLYVLVELIKVILGDKITSGARWARWAPVLAPLLGALMSPIVSDGWLVEGVPLGVGARAMAGLVAGWMSGGLYSTIAQTLMSKDRRLGGGSDVEHD
jgi:hypothetical protein